METRPGSPGSQDFLTRLHAIYDKKAPARRVDEFNFFPTRGMKTADLPPEIVLLRLVDNVHALQISVESEGRRNNRLLYMRSLARQLVGKLSQDDEAREFCYEQLSLLTDRAPEIAEDVLKLMTEAEDRKRFKRT